MRKSDLHERTGQLAWDDLRTVLAVARSGSLSGAARALGVEHSTVFRRIGEIEQRLGVRLFERERSGYLTNAHGEAVADAARIMEEAALAAERRVLGADTRLSGVVRIATSEMLATYLLPPLLGEFLAAHPAIEIEVDVANQTVDLGRREADLALRATVTPPETVIARRLADISYAVYATDAAAAGRSEAHQLTGVPWVGFSERLAMTPQARWLAEHFPAVAPRLRLDSFLAILQHAAAGVGAAVLPCFAAAQEPRLMRVSLPLDGPALGLWLLTHPDVRGNARVRALAQHLAERAPPLLARLIGNGRACEHLGATAPAKPRGRRRT